jgi:hypothetical protein
MPVALAFTGFVVGTTSTPVSASGGNRRNGIMIYGDDVGQAMWARMVSPDCNSEY